MAVLDSRNAGKPGYMNRLDRVLDAAQRRGFPPSGRVLLSAAMAYARVERWPKAITTFEKAASTFFPPAPQARSCLSHAAVFARETREGCGLLSVAVLALALSLTRSSRAFKNIVLGGGFLLASTDRRVLLQSCVFALVARTSSRYKTLRSSLVFAGQAYSPLLPPRGGYKRSTLEGGSRVHLGSKGGGAHGASAGCAGKLRGGERALGPPLQHSRGEDHFPPRRFSIDVPRVPGEGPPAQQEGLLASRRTPPPMLSVSHINDMSAAIPIV